MKQFFIFIFALLGLFACEKKPSPLAISEPELIPILADVHIAEAALQHLRGELKDSMANVYYEQLYEIHEISEEDFGQTMEALREDPIRLERIYTQVIELISELDAKSK